MECIDYNHLEVKLNPSLGSKFLGSERHDWMILENCMVCALSCEAC